MIVAVDAARGPDMKSTTDGDSNKWIDAAIEGWHGPDANVTIDGIITEAMSPAANAWNQAAEWCARLLQFLVLKAACDCGVREST